MPPYVASLGGAVRVLKLAEFLGERGIETHILTGQGRRYGDFGYAQVLQQLNIHYVDDPMLSLAGGGAVDQQEAGGWVSRIVAYGKRAGKPLALDLLVPDTGVVALHRFKRAARDLVARHRVSTVISSGPPHSDHLVALDLKRRNPSLVWIADYRDSWNGTTLFRKRFWPAQQLNLALERRVLRAADHVVAISQPMMDKAAALAGLPVEDAKFHLVMNGFDPSLLAEQGRWLNDGGVLKVGYFGFIDNRPGSYRDPKALFEAILVHDLPIVLELFGDARIDPIWRERLGARLRMHGNLSHAAAMEAMVKLDALMLLHTRSEGADEVITGKVFEYIAAARPIISIGPPNMAVNKLLSIDTAFYSVSHDDTEGVVKLLKDLCELKEKNALPSRGYHDIQKFSRKRQYEKLISIL
jgi:glycosyltransferase involved in cell wall biosynthesis